MTTAQVVIEQPRVTKAIVGEMVRVDRTDFEAAVARATERFDIPARLADQRPDSIKRSSN